MCGIFAAMTRSAISAQRIDRAHASLDHRGPDGRGSWVSANERWVLGHTRLSIIGLQNGQQPMSSADNRVHSVVNGEFYGYREIRRRLLEEGSQFVTDSDSEIALHLYQRRDTFASQAARDQPIYDMAKVNAALDQLLDCPDDQRISVEGGLQRIASVVVMQ